MLHTTAPALCHRPARSPPAPDSMADEYKSDGSGGKTALSVVIVGASGDLAKKKTYPALWELFRDGHIPKDVIMVGYARSAKEDSAFRSHLRPYVSALGVMCGGVHRCGLVHGLCAMWWPWRPVVVLLCSNLTLWHAPTVGRDAFRRYLESKAQGQDKLLSEFLERCWYRRGQYDSVEAFAAVAEELTKMEDAVNGGTNKANRLFYYAIPPTVFSMVSGPIKKAAKTSRGWNRVAIEKPFGMDLASSEVLSKQIAANFQESEVRCAASHRPLPLQGDGAKPRGAKPHGASVRQHGAFSAGRQDPGTEWAN